jgi:hypothetical protein
MVDLNRLLKASSMPVKVVASYGHTGNFIVESVAKREVVCQSMGRVLGTACAVLTVSELRALVQTLKKLKLPARLPRIRHTPGAVIQVHSSPVQSLPRQTTRATYRKFTPFIVIALKRDTTTSTGILDRNRRSGGWGAVAAEIAQKLGGRWTARSHRTITGSLRRALGIVGNV